MIGADRVIKVTVVGQPIKFNVTLSIDGQITTDITVPNYGELYSLLSELKAANECATIEVALDFIELLGEITGWIH